MRNTLFTKNNLQAGFVNLPNDSIVKTIIVATLLCLLCSIVVSASAVLLKPMQQNNKELDKKKNILSVSGFTDIAESDAAVDAQFAQIETVTIDLLTGEENHDIDSARYDPSKVVKSAATRIDLSTEQDIAKLGAIAQYANVYLVKDAQGKINRIILPISGYGLWGTLYGFIALEGDAKTVSGITFYEHKETAGLGGEVENPKWKALWEGKKVGQDGQVLLEVIKGRVSSNTANPEYKIDGLAGASLTSKGVSNLVKFWLGENGFALYLDKIKQAQATKVQHSQTGN